MMSGYATSTLAGRSRRRSSGDADDRAARKAGDRVEPGTHAGDVTGCPGQRAAATVSSRGVLLSWIEREGPRASLKFAERKSTGWSMPVTVASGDN
jgi:hypothetical protein